MGNVLGEIGDPDGNNNPVKCTRKTDVYGTQRASSGTAQSNHKFAGSLGHSSDPTTGLIYMRARYMDPATGRFVTQDPARDGINWFEYCGSNPVNRTDYTGRVLGFDDWLDEEARDGTASVEAKQQFQQRIEDAVMDWYDNLIRNIVGDCDDLTMEAGSRGNYRWIFQKDGVNYQMRLDISGHSGYAPHWNFDFAGPEHLVELSPELQDLLSLLGL